MIPLKLHVLLESSFPKVHILISMVVIFFFQVDSLICLHDDKHYNSREFLIFSWLFQHFYSRSESMLGDRFQISFTSLYLQKVCPQGCKRVRKVIYITHTMDDMSQQKKCCFKSTMILYKFRVILSFMLTKVQHLRDMVFSQNGSGERRENMF